MSESKSGEVMEELADITGRWARAHARDFPRWEVDELHSEAFLIAVKLIDKGRYDPDRAALSTFLWHALPMDVRHRYRRSQGQRYVTGEDGRRQYRQVEYIGTSSEDIIVSQWTGQLQTVDLEEQDAQWLKARAAGFKASELMRRGMSYSEQRAAAERLRDQRGQQ